MATRTIGECVDALLALHQGRNTNFVTPPASEDEIRAAEETLNLTLPPIVREIYSMDSKSVGSFNVASDVCLIPRYSPLGLELALEVRQRLLENKRDHEEVHGEGIGRQMEEGWLPILEDDCNIQFIVDVDPQSASYGHVIESHSDGTVRTWETDLASFYELVLTLHMEGAFGMSDLGWFTLVDFETYKKILAKKPGTSPGNS